MRTIGVLTSGGDAPGMNAAVRAVVRGAVSLDMRVYGIYDGYYGLMRGDLHEMDVKSVSDILHRGGTFLRTARCMEMLTEEGVKKAAEQAALFDLDGLVVIGGDGSYRGALALAKEGLRTVGVPATIDNDLAYTDWTIGYDTAVNTCVNAINLIRDTSASHGRITIIEVMGRACGDIALAAGVAGGAEYVFIPEVEPNLELLMKKIDRGRARGKRHNIIIRAEGANIGTDELVNMIANHTQGEVRKVVLGYLQRGGTPTATDRIIASKMGYRAAEILTGEGNARAVGMHGVEVFDMDLEEALNMTRIVDTEEIRLMETLAI